MQSKHKVEKVIKKKEETGFERIRKEIEQMVKVGQAEKKKR